MTRQTKRTISRKAPKKSMRRDKLEGRMLVGGWKVVSADYLIADAHTYRARKIKFYPNLFIYGAYNSPSLTSAHFSHIHRGKWKTTRVGSQSHPQSYLFNKRNGTRKHKFAFYVDKKLFFLLPSLFLVD